MRQRKSRLASVVVALAVTACSESFSLWESTATEGGIFVLNKVTGEFYAIEDGALRPIPRDTSRAWIGGNEAEIAARSLALSRSQWIAQDVVKVEVATKYRGGRVELKGSVTPCTEGLRPVYGGQVLGLQFLDRHDFRVVEVDIQGTDLTRTLDYDAKCTAFSFNTRADVSAEDWRDVTNLSVTWVNAVSDAAEKWAKANPQDAETRKSQAQLDRIDDLSRMLKELGKEAPPDGGKIEPSQDDPIPDSKSEDSESTSPRT